MSATASTAAKPSTDGEAKGKMPAATVDRRASSKGDDGFEFIAADLTLYSNPLNNALHIAGRPDTGCSTKPKQAPRQKEEGEDEIAADMTKYDSPMADLDKRRNDKVDASNNVN